MNKYVQQLNYTSQLSMEFYMEVVIESPATKLYVLTPFIVGYFHLNIFSLCILFSKGSKLVKWGDTSSFQNFQF